MERTFTGADQAKAGQIELASTGVLLLDEVSEMGPMAQAKLLRVLQEREFRRLGGTRPVKANVRVISASNGDLQRAVAERTNVAASRTEATFASHIAFGHAPAQGSDPEQDEVAMEVDARNDP